MKHQYFGDINDYVKYGLLRCFAEVGFRIGVLWMLTPEDGQPDGRKIKYLSRPERVFLPQTFSLIEKKFEFIVDKRHRMVTVQKLT